jgi:choline dehydrogenase
MLHADPLSGAFIKAAVEAGIPDNPDFNGATQEGAGWFQTTRGTASGRARRGVSARQRTRNLHVETAALAAYPVRGARRRCRIPQKQGLRTVRARNPGLGGAYNSPQLLQLSGVGPAELLKNHGINVVLDAPGVGNDLRDHMQVLS